MTPDPSWITTNHLQASNNRFSASFYHKVHFTAYYFFPKSPLIWKSGSTLKETLERWPKEDFKCFWNQKTTILFAACPKRLLTRAEKPSAALEPQRDISYHFSDLLGFLPEMWKKNIKFLFMWQTQSHTWVLSCKAYLWARLRTEPEMVCPDTLIHTCNTKF